MALLRSRLRAEDWARTHQLSAYKTAAQVLASLLSGTADKSRALARFLATGNGKDRRPWLVHKALQAERQRRSSVPCTATRNPVKLHRSIIAKPSISSHERGILFVSFESELAKILDQRFELLEQRYQIAFMPTWQPAYSAELFKLAARAKQPYLVLSSSPYDENLTQELGPLCWTIPLHAACWIPEDHFAENLEKDIDLLLLANFSKYKRHWRLFEGLAQCKKRYRVVCAGRPWDGRSMQAILDEARLFGVEDQVQVVQDPSDEEVSDLLSRARLFCAMSHKEGSFVAVAEAMVAGTPVGMFDDAIIGTRAFVNGQTGIFFDHRKPLGPQLDQVLQVSDEFRPREWACREFTARPSIAKFNATMKTLSQKHGLPWTEDARVIYCRNFEFDYVNQADRTALAAEYAKLHKSYDVEVVLLSGRV